ncbi:MAG: LCP family protein [Actinomycetota bacterium]
MAEPSDPSPGRLPRALLAVAASVSLVVGLSAAASYAGILWLEEKLKEPNFDPFGRPSGESPGASLLGGECESECNFLVLGSDSREGLTAKERRNFLSDEEIGGYRSDTMLLVSINDETRHATIISFPRDLLVDIPGHGRDKINAAFQYGSANGGIAGGAQLAAETVAKLTGLRINHLVVVDLQGFKAVVEALDTVPFCTPVSLRDDPQAFGEPPENGGSGLNLAAGCHDLDGDTALALVRARYVVAGGVQDCISDYARISRQQQFMRALLNKALSPTVLPKLPEVVDAVTQKLTFDKGIQLFDLVHLSKALEGVASGNADFRVVPNVLAPNEADLVITPQGRQFLTKLRNGEPLGDLGTKLQYQPPTPAEIAIRVYDDASEGHAQNDVYREQLADSGFKMLATDAEPAGDLAGVGTVILYRRTAKEEAQVVSGYVPGVKLKAAAPGQLPDDTEVAVVVTAEYKYRDPGTGETTAVTEKCPYT